MENFKSQDFYIVLPSTSSDSTYSNNATSNFRTKLPETISLQGSWEVALTSISFNNKVNQFTSAKEKHMTFTLKPIIGRVHNVISETQNDTSTPLIRDSGRPSVILPETDEADKLQGRFQQLATASNSRIAENSESSQSSPPNEIQPEKPPKDIFQHKTADGVLLKVN